MHAFSSLQTLNSNLITFMFVQTCKKKYEDKERSLTSSVQEWKRYKRKQKQMPRMQWTKNFLYLMH